MYHGGIPEGDDARTKLDPLTAALVGWSFGFVIGLLFNLFRYIINKRASKEWININDLLGEIMYLIQYVSFSDGDISRKEKEYVVERSKAYFKEKQISEIEERLNQPFEYDKGKIAKLKARLGDNYTFPQKRRIMYLLIGLTVSDSFLDDDEKDAVYEIADGIGFPGIFVERIYAMHHFTTMESYKSHEKERAEKAKRTFSREEAALLILDLEISAEEDDIKSAYRNLAKQYHPDMLLKADEQLKSISEEQFHRLQQAYEYLKEKRGIK
jgi:DnaJ like chaperone protein